MGMHIKLFVIVFGNLISATIGLWPLIVYTSPLIIDKPSNTDCATLECEAKKNTEVYKRVDNHNEAQQCYSYTECLNKAVEFIGSENFTLRDEVPKINLTRDELLATVIYTTNLFSDFNWRSRNVAGNSSLDHTDAKGLNPYRIFYHTLLSASRKIEQFYKGPTRQLYRGIRAECSVASDNIYFNSFTSASVSLAQAHRYAGPDGCTFHIITVHGAPLMKFSIAPGEEEVLLTPETLYTVDRKQTNTTAIFVNASKPWPPISSDFVSLFYG